MPGLASGFLEPLESTSIDIIQAGIIRFIATISTGGLMPSAQKEYNRAMATTYERTRDFIMLHYVITRRNDSQFWRDMQTIEKPELLAHRIDLFTQTSNHANYEFDIFGETNWLAVMHGQGLPMQNYNVIANTMNENEFNTNMSQMSHAIIELVKQMPTHQEFINRYCKAEKN